MTRLGGFTGRNGRSACAARFAVGAVLVAFGFGCSPGGLPANETGSTLTPASPPPSRITLVEHSDPEELFKLVLAEQEKSMRKLRRLKFTSHWEVNWVTPGKENRLIHDRKVIRDGDSAWCEVHVNPPVTRQGFTAQVTYRVWNDKYMVMWGPGPTGDAGGHMWEYENLDLMPEQARGAMLPAGAFPERKYSFGTGMHALSRVGNLDARKYPSRFEAVRSADTEGRIFYTPTGWMADRNSYPRPSWVLTVDSAKGYMVTEGLNQLADLVVGKMREFTVTPKEIAPDVWFPVEWTILNYGVIDPTTGKQPPTTISKYTVTDLQYDPVIEPDQFTWKSLKLPPETMFMRQDKSGDITLVNLINGELIPSDIAASR